MQINKLEKNIRVNELEFEPYISAEQIRERVAQMGAALTQQFEGKCPLVIGVLNGSFVFVADLCREMKVECELSFIKLSSYSGTQSTGKVITMIGMEADVKGRDLIIMEDIVDTGKTLYQFMQTLTEKEPASITMVSLLVKPDAIEYAFPIHYTGFEIPNKFVVGYGLDYDGLCRNLPGIYQLVNKEEV